MGAQPVYELTGRPWPCCSDCGHEVRARTGGRNLPCRCVAGVDDSCPECCGDTEAADALQEALEESDREVMAQRRADIDRRVEEALQQAAVYRPGLTAVILVAMAIGLLAGAFGTLL